MARLWRVIEQSDKNYPTLKEAATAIEEELKDFANDRKVQKTLNKYYEDNAEKEIKNEPVNQEKIVQDIVEDEPKKEEAPVQKQPETQP